jgi:hypothetical protein
MLGRIGRMIVLGLIGTMLCLPSLALAQSTLKTTKQDATKKVEGWASVPGGQVWLEPGRHAYEHDTGLVRDLQTGQKSIPITPQQLQSRQVPPTYFGPPAFVQPTYVQPPYVQPLASPLFVQPRYLQPWYDLGPNNVYAQPPGVGNNFGAKLGSPGSINHRWRATQLPGSDRAFAPRY